MQMKKTILGLVAFSLLTACGDSTTTYDDSWGDSQLVSFGGKADLIDDVQAFDLGDGVEGQVTSRATDLYKISLTTGDKIKLVNTATSGDLNPSVSLYTRTGSSVRSDSYKVGDQKITKYFTADWTGEYLVAVRAYRNQGAGNYKVESACEGGPCAGEFNEPDTEILASDIVECIYDARECSFEKLPSYNGYVGTVRANSIFNKCLGQASTIDGYSCETACELDDAGELCESIISELPFYADQTSTCVDTLNNCMDECAEFADWGWGDEVWSSSLAMCQMNGFNGTCDYVRELPECGGNLTNETAVCYRECHVMPGAFIDDMDILCEEDCGDCGIECQLQRDGEVWSGIPNDGLFGDIVHSDGGDFGGELGDLCFATVRVLEGGHGELPPGDYAVYGFTQSTCLADYGSFGGEFGVHIPLNNLERETDPKFLDEMKRLGDFEGVFGWDGELEEVIY